MQQQKRSITLDVENDKIKKRKFDDHQDNNGEMMNETQRRPIQDIFGALPRELLHLIFQYLSLHYLVKDLSLVNRYIHDLILGGDNNIETINLWTQLLSQQRIILRDIKQYEQLAAVTQRLRFSNICILASTDALPDAIIVKYLHLIEPFVQSLVIFGGGKYLPNNLQFPALTSIETWQCGTNLLNVFCNGDRSRYKKLFIDNEIITGGFTNLETLLFGNEEQSEASICSIVSECSSTLTALHIDAVLHTGDILPLLQRSCTHLNVLHIHFDDTVTLQSPALPMVNLKELVITCSVELFNQLFWCKYPKLSEMRLACIDGSRSEARIQIEPFQVLRKVILFYSFPALFPFINHDLEHLMLPNKPINIIDIQHFSKLQSCTFTVSDNSVAYTLVENNRRTLTDLSIFSTDSNSFDIQQLKYLINLTNFKIHGGRFMNGLKCMSEFAQILPHIDNLFISNHGTQFKLDLNIDSNVQWKAIKLYFQSFSIQPSFFEKCSQLTHLDLQPNFVDRSVFWMAAEHLSKIPNTIRSLCLDFNGCPPSDSNQYFFMFPSTIEELKGSISSLINLFTLKEFLICIICCHRVQRMVFLSINRGLLNRLLATHGYKHVTRWNIVSILHKELMLVLQHEDRLRLSEEERTSIEQDYETIFRTGEEDTFVQRIQKYPALLTAYRLFEPEN